MKEMTMTSKFQKHKKWFLKVESMQFCDLLQECSGAWKKKIKEQANHKFNPVLRLGHGSRLDGRSLRRGLQVLNGWSQKTGWTKKQGWGSQTKGCWGTRGTGDKQNAQVGTLQGPQPDVQLKCGSLGDMIWVSATECMHARIPNITHGQGRRRTWSELSAVHLGPEEETPWQKGGALRTRDNEVGANKAQCLWVTGGGEGLEKPPLKPVAPWRCHWIASPHSPGLTPNLSLPGMALNTSVPKRPSLLPFTLPPLPHTVQFLCTGMCFPNLCFWPKFLFKLQTTRSLHLDVFMVPQTQHDQKWIYFSHWQDTAGCSG